MIWRALIRLPSSVGRLLTKPNEIFQWYNFISCTHNALYVLGLKCTRQDEALNKNTIIVYYEHKNTIILCKYPAWFSSNNNPGLDDLKGHLKETFKCYYFQYLSSHKPSLKNSNIQFWKRAGNRNILWKPQTLNDLKFWDHPLCAFCLLSMI